MGGNRDDSYDSRYFGFVPREELVGRARFVALSLDPERHGLLRHDRWGLALRCARRRRDRDLPCAICCRTCVPFQSAKDQAADAVDLRTISIASSSDCS